ncbi:MAG TPA: thioredoxin domain-containing protein, partial [Actinomycetota bacterium]|nr:thioredoxin domain-containing protein [Actinomycetota bacterium]
MNSTGSPSSNRLAGAASSYLSRSASQPVDWYPWDGQAFNRAAELGRPLIVSVGYATSHQCAAADALFDDPEVARVVNDNFVAVKVDRQERPDIDAHLTKLAGALNPDTSPPLTVFLTPEGGVFGSRPPVVGDSAGDLRSNLERIAREWSENPEETRRRASEAVETLRRSAAEAPHGEPVGPPLLQQAVFALQAAFDDTNGGFGEAPRTAQAPAVEFMLRAAGRGVARAATVSDSTLRNMAKGGIYDQIGGGFHHLAVDRTWRVPRFEKLLVDNALLARAYLHAWQLGKDEMFSRIALETLEYLMRDLSDPAGAFYAGQSADSDGTEGAFYTWSHDEFIRVAPDAAGAFGVTKSGNFRGRSVLSLMGDTVPGAAQAALLKRRTERAHPEVDDQVLTSWNGLAIAALAEAGAALDRLDLVEAARRAASTLLLRNRHVASGKLWHTHPDGDNAIPGLLEDYAYLAEGLYTLWEATFEPEWITTCEELVRRMIDDFWDPAGGLFSTPAGFDDRVPRIKDSVDGAGPNPASVASVLLGKLAVLTGNQDYRRRQIAIAEDAAPAVQGRFLESSGMLSAIDALLARPTEIVVLGSTSDRRTRELRKAIWVRYLPNKVCAGAPPLIPFPILEGKEPVGDAPTAHISQGGVRKPPVLAPEDFDTALKFWTSPSEGQVNRVTTLINNALQLRHFLDNLQNPAWIEPLRDAGLFETPPPPIYDFAEGTVGSPPWAQSKYLARMAPFSPEAVHEVALSVPYAENVQVHEDLADVALALPPDLAARFVPKVRDWLRSPYLLHLPEKLGSLIVHLANGGQTAAAVELAAVTLELRPTDPTLAKQPMWLAPEPRGWFGRFAYENIVKDQIPALARKSPLPTLELVADLLSSAISLSFRPGDEEPPTDYSHLWRPAIHEHEQNVDRTLRDPLAGALADIAEEIAREQPTLVPELVSRLERREWHIFRRVALHLLRVWPEIAPDAIERRLTDRHLFADPHFHHEYLLLARDHFEELSPEDQAVILGWVDQGPDADLWRSDPRTMVMEPGEYRDRWRLDRLAMLHESLPPSHLEEYERLAERYGPPEHPDFVVHFPGVRSDPTTPRQADDLHESDLDELVEYLSVWKPAPGLGNPTVEGLARKLAAVVATEPVKFAEVADSFTELDPAYVWAVLQGLREAAEGFEFDWAPVLQLAKWTASQHPGAQTAARWRPARLEVLRLLARGFGQGPAQMPLRFRETAWAAIRPLTDDPDPDTSPAYSPEQVNGAAIQSINSVRGEAMHTVVRYALWLRRDIESSPNMRERLSRGFGEMPEVRDVLEAHLDPANDPSPAIRSVYGRWFSFLLMLDGHWTAERVNRIFPADPALQDLRDAAWEAHISYSSPYDHLLSVIEGEYRRAVDLVDRFESRPGNVVTPESRLAEHLMVFYLRGKLALDKGGLVGRFFAKASDKLRHHALSFIGRSLKNQPGQLPRDVAM